MIINIVHNYDCIIVLPPNMELLTALYKVGMIAACMWL